MLRSPSSRLLLLNEDVAPPNLGVDFGALRLPHLRVPLEREA